MLQKTNASGSITTTIGAILEALVLRFEGFFVRWKCILQGFK